MSQDLVLHMRRLKDLWCEYDVDLYKRSLSDDYVSYKSRYILHPNIEICCEKKLNVVHDKRYDTPFCKRYTLSNKSEYGNAARHIYAEFLFEKHNSSYVPKDGV